MKKYYNLKSSGWRIKAEYIKKLLSMCPEDEPEFLILKHQRRIPLYGDKELLYILGLISGDGHLRYSPKYHTVSQVLFTNNDKQVIDRYRKAVKKTFNVELKQYRGDSSTYYFNSKPIGNLLHNLGIPVSNKSLNIQVPPYTMYLPTPLLISYLQGLYDSDGSVQFVKNKSNNSGVHQVVYYTKSKELARGIRYCLLRLGIVSTLSQKKRDHIWAVYISDAESIQKFKKTILFTQEKRRIMMETILTTKYTKPSYDRIPISKWINQIAKEVNISQRELLRNGVNTRVGGLTLSQLEKTHDLFAQKNMNPAHLEIIEQLMKMDLIWTPIRNIQNSNSHVYDFEVPDQHNFVANGILVHNSEANLRKFFEEARENSPSILFIDEIDALAPKREEAKGEVERRVVAQMLSLMDGLESRGHVVVIGATNRPNDIDPALRRPGRFDREIGIPVPDRHGRLEILHVHTRGMPLNEDVDLKQLAQLTHGFVGADLAALSKEAAIHTLRKLLPQIDVEVESISREVLDKLEVNFDDFLNALKEVEPSALREVIIERPTTKWTDIGGLDEVKRILQEVVEWPLKYGGLFKELHLKASKGVLLYGPPGTGKTLLARAVAGESEANFISIKGPELLSKWVGESEKGIRQIFKKAKQAAPTVIFFDEFDALATMRSSGNSDSGVGNRVLSQLLTELDGIEELRNVIVVAATNRPDLIDMALLRPGRLDQLLSIELPDINARKEILKLHIHEAKLAEDFDIDTITTATEGFSGADLEAIAQEAKMLALRDFIKKYPEPEQADEHVAEFSVTQKYFNAALKIHRQRPTIEQVTKSKARDPMLG